MSDSGDAHATEDQNRALISEPAAKEGSFPAVIALSAAVGVACGLSSAVFLLLLDRATRFREGHEYIVFTLPLAGALIGWLYERWGKPIRGGNNLIIDAIHDGAPEIPLRMAPMVLVGTVLTHLFGGSAGREGTAVQMGGSLADASARMLGVGRETRRVLLAAGVAGGFGSVFGTPIAGTIFALEVVWLGRVEYVALLPALTAALVGDFTTRHLGVVHTTYPAVAFTELTLATLGKLIAIGIGMAAAAIAFVDLTHALKHQFEKRLPRLPFRMLIGGIVLVCLWRLVGTSEYLGLGVPTIVRAFSDPQLPWYTFAVKVVFTAITLGAGFLGGEVTPLFFVGSTLGNVLASWFGLPIALGAGVGMAALFGACANTPIALSIMAVELVGGAALPHVVIVAVIAYHISGHRSIYSAQRLGHKKLGRRLPRVLALRDLPRD